MDIIIRNEEGKDYFEVENLIREAFWNIYRPGCSEHLVAHNLRTNKAFIKELDYVAQKDGQIIASIMYSHVTLKLDNGDIKDFISFGPVAVHPDFQGTGIGQRLIRYTLEKAEQLGYLAVFITGNPKYYERFGFEAACKYGIFLDENRNAEEANFFMVKILRDGVLNLATGLVEFSSCFEPSKEEIEEFDKQFVPKVKEKRPGQFEE